MKTKRILNCGYISTKEDINGKNLIIIGEKYEGLSYFLSDAMYREKEIKLIFNSPSEVLKYMLEYKCTANSITFKGEFPFLADILAIECLAKLRPNTGFWGINEMDIYVQDINPRLPKDLTSAIKYCESNPNVSWVAEIWKKI
jgi:hypothetical protein